MSSDHHNVSFRDPEVGNWCQMLVTSEQAAAILRVRVGEKVCLDYGEWVRLQRSSKPGGDENVFYYHHGERGGHGYVLAREAELREAMRRVIAGQE